MTLQDEHHEEEQRLEEVSLEAGLEVETERDQEEGQEDDQAVVLHSNNLQAELQQHEDLLACGSDCCSNHQIPYQPSSKQIL